VLILDKFEQSLRQKFADAKAKAEQLNVENKLEEAKAALEEAKQAKMALDTYLETKALAVPEPPAAPKAGIIDPKDEDDKPKYKNVFLKAIRGQRLTAEEQEVLAANYIENPKNKLSSGSGPDGGYIIPEDITTTINELKMTVDNLEQYVTVVPVSTNKGSRTLERRADSTPFQKLSEYGDPNAMAEMDSPQFDRLSYAIEDYAGFLPVSNDLLNDTDQALESYLRQWIAKKSRATRNSLILTVLAALDKSLIAGNLVDGIKKVLNVELDPAFSLGATIFTNQDGFNYLDTVKDANGRYLLEDDIKSPSGKSIKGRPVIPLSNKTIATTAEGLAPFIAGDLKEAVVLWDREQMSVDMTKEGGNAWRTNTTEFRAIEREDVTSWDAEAVVYGQFDITPVA
jgi:HK97 family phage major capsid protein